MFNDGSKVRRQGLNERRRQEQQRQTRKQRSARCFFWFRSTGWKWFLAFTLAVFGVWQGWYWLRQLNPGQMLVLKNLEIQGNQQVGWEEIALIAGVETGVPMGSLQLDSISARLENEARIRAVSVKRIFPSTLRIQVEEARALFLFQSSRGWKIYSEKGEELPIAVHPTLALPMVVAESKQSRLRAGQFLMNMLKTDSLLYTRVSQVVASEQYQEVFFRDAGYKALFASQVDQKEVFHHYRLLTQGSSVSLAGVKIVDMRFPGFAYTIPYQKGRDDG